MTKDQTKRPSTAEIFKMDYVRSRMQQFVENAEQDILENGGVYKKQKPTIVRANTRELIAAGDGFHPDQDLSTTGGSDLPNVQVDLTPKERMKLRKEAEIKRREEEMKAAARGAKANYTQAKVTRQQNHFESIMNASARVPNFDPAQQESFLVPADNFRGGQMYPHQRLQGQDGRVEEHKAAVETMTQNFGTVVSLDLTGRSDLS